MSVSPKSLEEVDTFINKRWDEALAFYSVEHVYDLPKEVYMSICIGLNDYLVNNFGFSLMFWPEDIRAKFHGLRIYSNQ